MHGLPSARCATYIKTFIKLESYPEFKEARLINSRCDEFKAYAGPFFSAIEQELYKHPSFIKHTPVPDRPGVVNGMYAGNSLHYYENDYKSFEAHFTPQIMKACELQLYTHCLSKYPKDAAFICRVIGGVNKLHAPCGRRFKLTARRMSGDMCTSLGNGFTNLMMYLYILYLKNGEGKALVEGDDGLFACNVPLTKEDFLDLGFTVEIHELEHPRYGHFCGMTCSENGEVLKDPRRVLSSFGWTSSNIHSGNKVMMELLRSKALSLSYEAPQCPVTGLLAREALRFTEGFAPRAEPGAWKETPADFNGPTGPFGPSEDARAVYERAYGVSPAVQLIVESEILHGRFGDIHNYITPHEHMAEYVEKYLEYR